MKEREVDDATISPQKNTLNSISFKIDAGKSIALVGTTGSGKSTSVKLLFRF